MHWSGNYGLPRTPEHAKHGKQRGRRRLLGAAAAAAEQKVVLKKREVPETDTVVAKADWASCAAPAGSTVRQQQDCFCTFHGVSGLLRIP